MKILMLTPYLPYPPSSGGQIRTFNLIKYLSKKHEVTLVALYKNKAEKKYSKHIKKYCKNVYLCKRPESPWEIKNILKTIFSLSPFLIVRNSSEEARNTISKILKNEKFDIIHAETFYIMPHIPTTNIPIILVEQTIEYRVYQHFVNNLPFFLRPFFYLDIIKLKHWERHFWRKADIVATVNDSDKKTILRLEPKTKTTIIENAAGDDMFKIKKERQKNKTKFNLFFIGNFSWLQNVEAAKIITDKIYPLLKKSSNIRLCNGKQDKKCVQIIIAGQRSVEKLKMKTQKGLRIIDIKHKGDNIVNKLFQEADVFISPIFGPGGTRLKLLAAMATKTPIISTSIGIDGLMLTNKKNVLIAETPEEFVKQISLVINNQDLYERIKNEAYKHVKKYFTWDKIAVKLEHIYEEII